MTLRTLSFLLASPTVTFSRTGRQFQFVEYGSPFSGSDDGRPTISCDGRIPGGVTLELTHWNGNETPEDLYQDTSTGMALKLAENQEYSQIVANAWVLNNHFDTDGALSVWACLEPELALQHADLLVQGAEAGDFGEWSSDLGVKLDSALLELCSQSKDEQAAYYKAIQELPSLLEDLKATGGMSYEKLWKPGFDSALESWDLLRRNEAMLKPFNDDIVVLTKPASLPPISPFGLHRCLVSKGLDATTKRILHVTEEADKTVSYQYEKAGHGWVNKLVQRPVVPPVDAAKLVENLNAQEGGGSWKTGGPSLISICRTAEAGSMSVEEVTHMIAKFDEGLTST